MTTFDDHCIWQDASQAASPGWYDAAATRMLTQCDFCRWGRGIDRFRS